MGYNELALFFNLSRSFSYSLAQTVNFTCLNESNIGTFAYKELNLLPESFAIPYFFTF
jgi:hypothetical protein